MSRTFRKLKRRGVKTSLARFLSILGIVVIGAGFLAGLLSTAPDMKMTVDRYMDETSIHDIDVKGTLGITEEDVALLRAADGVETVMPAYVTDLIVLGEDGAEYVARLYGVPLAARGTDAFLNDFKLVGGRLPEEPNEVLLLTPSWLAQQAHSLNEKYVMSPDNTDYEDRADTYAGDAYTVVGFVQSPQHMTVEHESSGVGTGGVDLFFYTVEEAYTLDVYTDAFIRMTDSVSMDAFSDEYQARADALTDRLEDMGEERGAVRFAEVKEEAQEEIDDAQVDIDDAQKELDDARADADADIADARKKIADAHVELDDAKADYADGEKEIKRARIKYTEAENDFKSEIRKQRSQLADTRAAMNMPYEMWQNLKNEIDQAESSGNEELYRQWKKIADAEEELADGAQEIADAEKKLADAETELNDAEADADREIADAQKKLDDAQVTLDDAQKELDDLEEPEWRILDREDIVSFTSYESNTEKIDAIARVFPIFLFLVAALVALTTMTRMVEEERTQIGTLKALGYSNRKILFYYLGYSFWATLLGSAIGIFLGMWLLPRAISQAYDMMYTLPPIITVMRWNYAVWIAAVSVLCTSAATLWACLSIMQEKPARMMLPRAPEPGKRIFLEYVTFVWKRLKFTQKVTCRNIFRYKKRLYMTMFGIAGCTALLITGFGIRDSINDIVDKQFYELYQYDMTVYLKESDALTENAALQDFFNASGKVASYAAVYSETGTVQAQSDSEEVNIYVPEETAMLKQHILLRERKTGADVSFSEDSVVLTEKLCETLSLSVGDTFTLVSHDGVEAELTVTGITENYITAYAFISLATYERCFGETPEFDQVIARLSDAGAVDEEAVAATLLKDDDVALVSFTSSIKDSFNNIISNINYIVYVLIVAAGALAMIVLYNLTNINISERKKELATIKVLGFYEPEVAKYIYRETTMLSILGSIIGIGLGYWLHAFVVRTAEVDAVMFGRTLYPRAILIALAITMLFTLFVDLLMLPVIRHIDMVESMKAND